MVSAVSLGVLNGEVITDLCYHEDHQADVDLNVVATQAGIVEIQGTGETGPFSREHLDQMIELGMSGCQQLRRFQQAVLDNWFSRRTNGVRCRLEHTVKLLIATQNQHKLEEFRRLFGTVPMIGLDRFPDFVMPEETGDDLPRKRVD